MTSDAEFLGLRAEWDELVASDPSATVFQTWEFQYYGWKMVSDRVSPHLVLMRDEGGTLVGCVPLGTRIRRLEPLRIRVLEFACSRWADYSAVIARAGATESVVTVLGEWLRLNGKRWDVIRLGPMRDDSAMWTRRDLFTATVGFPHHTSTVDSAYFISFEPGWRSYQDVLTGLGKRWAKKRRQEVRRLVEERGAEFKSVTCEPELTPALDALIELHQARQRAMLQLGRLGSEHVRVGFRALARSLATRGRAAVHMIVAQDRVLAALMTFDFRGCRSLWVIGTDATDDRISPGHVLHALCIDDALQRGLTDFDFLIGREEYKTRWARDERLVHSIEFHTGRWRHLPLVWSERARARLVASKRWRLAYLALIDGQRRQLLLRRAISVGRRGLQQVGRRVVWGSVHVAFDLCTGMETRGSVSEQELGFEAGGGRAGYQPTSLSALNRTFQELSISSEDVFVDFGSGKGRAIFWAARQPFKRVIGVEIAEKLNQTARRNIEKNRHRLRCRDIQLVTADAAAYSVPDDMTVAYLFNPFNGDVFRRVLDNICASLDRRPRPLRIIYVNPILSDELVRRGFNEKDIGRNTRLYWR